MKNQLRGKSDEQTAFKSQGAPKKASLLDILRCWDASRKTVICAEYKCFSKTSTYTELGGLFAGTEKMGVLGGKAYKM